MTKEQILEALAKKYGFNNWGECMWETGETLQELYATEAMEQYVNQELTAEREKAAKLVEALECLIPAFERYGPYQRVIDIKTCIDNYKQSLTEYKKQ